MPHIVTDIELLFRGATEPILFTCDERRGDTMETSKDDRVYRVQLPDGLEDVHIVRWEEVRYARLTQRMVEDDPTAVYIGDGASVSGLVPEPS